MVCTASWGIICHLPPFRGTRNNHWYNAVPKTLLRYRNSFPAVWPAFLQRLGGKDRLRRNARFGKWILKVRLGRDGENTMHIHANVCWRYLWVYSLYSMYSTCCFLIFFFKPMVNFKYFAWPSMSSLFSHSEYRGSLGLRRNPQKPQEGTTPRPQHPEFGWIQKRLEVWMFPKIGGKPPKMDGENNGSNPMNKWMIWGGGGVPIFLETPIESSTIPLKLQKSSNW